MGVSGSLAGALAGALPPARDPRRTADDDTYPLPPAAPPGDRITIFATVAVRTSQGSGPGVLELPRDEAARMVADRHAVYGSQPPRGFSDGGADGRTIAAMMPRREGG